MQEDAARDLESARCSTAVIRTQFFPQDFLHRSETHTLPRRTFVHSEFILKVSQS
ncbi:hypothetical protein CERZMDRAFT_110446 [Cercospora zeae-maydis SCOH1-5]|uniref:Uncharacterized protein n=1 Tax=Cercospora zeae-maydis SCOH1-5 TaxID=717836 RepID=A0A6A6FN85_9PEZI|nr:hypothetical protein CERZMDRAFT_110446 [Cercospora zeae-maydis SCOH1-5]